MNEKPGSLYLLALMGHREVLRDARVAPRFTGYSDLRADEYRLGLVLAAYTWTLEGSSLALEGCASSLGRRLVDREPGWSSRAGVDF
ncbi:hypothetical protein BHM03_00058996 [Ensete ventricosum]|nr:hypothetical protein BHM03_00058996 [Ensete ventricosum]